MPAEPLRRTIQAVQLTDDEIRNITRNAARDAERILRSLEGKEGVGAKVRSAQLQLAKANAEMWNNVKDATRVGIGDAVDSAAEYQALFDEALFSRAGLSSSYWRQSVLATAREGIESIISRKEHSYDLSQRVYRNAALSKGYIDNAINNGLLLGKSAAEIAKDVKRFIDPATPGGASYAAMRLARSEVNNAYHTTAVRNAQNTPWVSIMKWTLSGSHPRPDECNEYAEESHFRNGSPGYFKVDDVPAKPHPQCLCYVEPIADDLDTFAKNFKSGKYDGWLNETMGTMRSSVGSISPIPMGISHAEARAIYATVRREMKGLTDSAIRREAARRMGVDYDTYLSAWKKPKAVDIKPPIDDLTTPKIEPFKPSPKPVEPAPPVIDITYDSTRAQFKAVKREMPHLTDAQVRREAAKRMGTDYDTYLKAWKKPTDARTTVAPKPPTPPKVRVPKITKHSVPADDLSWYSDSLRSDVKLAREIRYGDKVLGKIQRAKEGYWEMDGRIRTGRFIVERSGYVVKDAEGRVLKNGGFNVIFRTEEDAIKALRDRAGVPEVAPVSTPTDLQPDLFPKIPTGVERADWHPVIRLRDDPNLATVNPNIFKQGRPEGHTYQEWSHNCTSCTSSYELRRRGYDVTSIPMGMGKPLNQLYRDWGIKEQVGDPNGAWGMYPRAIHPATIPIHTKNFPDGARGFLTVYWKRGGAHIINWEKRNGRIVWIDAQSGTVYNDGYMWDRTTMEAYMVRTDNIPVPETVKNWTRVNTQWH